MKYSKGIYNEYKVVEDGLVSDPYWGEGRLILALVLHSKRDTQLKELLRVHKDIGSGDVVVSWGRRVSNIFKKERLFLQIKFLKPKEFIFQISFSVEKEFTLINTIFKSRGVYISVGEKGDKVAKKFQEDSRDFILIEVPDTELDTWWEKKMYKVLYKMMTKKKIPKKDRDKAIKVHLEEMKTILNLRRDI